MRTIQNWSIVGLGLAIILSVALAIPGVTEGADRQIIRLGTAPPGSNSFPVMVGVATIVNKRAPELALTTQVTGGSVANVRLIDQGKIEAGVASGLTVGLAMAGKPPFKGKKKVQVLLSMYRQRIHWGVRDPKKVKKWEDLVGKKIAAGTPGGSARLLGDFVADAKGLRDKAKIIYLKARSVISGLRDGTIDAGWVIDAAGTPSSPSREILATGKVKFIGVDKETAKKIAAEKAGVFALDVPQGLFKGGAYGPKGNPPYSTIGEYLLMVVPPSMSEEASYKIVKTVAENYGEMGGFWPGLKKMTKEDLVKGIPSNASFHPGALRAYKELGLLK